jgi:N-acetylmuramoyl-L-alanine amidase
VAPVFRAGTLVSLNELPILPGHSGETVADMQHRLAAVGFPLADRELVYGDHTIAALRHFQESVGLRADGLCDEHTWAMLVEAGRELGERPLQLTTPLMRGDDVLELQSKLGRLGFDCGKVDGIFGPATLQGVTEFQRNSGLVVDGVCGPRTLSMLARVSSQSGSGPGVAALRERFGADNALASLVEARIVLGAFGAGLGVIRPLGKALRAAGAQVVPIDDPDPHVHAQTANQFNAGVYLGFDVVSQPTHVITYFAVPAFESLSGRRLAERCAVALESRRLAAHVDVNGRRLAVLRETRMPAVLCTIGPIRDAINSARAITGAICDGLASWTQLPKS